MFQYLTRLITVDYIEREISNRDLKVSSLFHPRRHVYGAFEQATGPGATGDASNEELISDPDEVSECSETLTLRKLTGEASE